MTIRLACAEDTIHVVRSLQNKKMSYNTPAHAKDDIANGYLYVMEDCGKIIASCAFFPSHRGYMAIKRLCIYNKKNKGKGIAKEFFAFFSSMPYPAFGCTPWNDNPAILHVVEKAGFKYQYTFNEKYCFYLLTK